MSDRPKVTGIGGIFFKCNDPKKLKNWYAEHLGFDTDEYGAIFKTRQLEDPTQSSYLQWSTFSNDSDHMKPSNKEFMINYRVNNLEGLLDQLKENGIKVIGDIAVYDYGKFAHIIDPEGNKIELWEPVDKVFDEYHNQGNKS